MSERVSKVVHTLLKRDVIRSAFMVFFIAMMVQLWMFAKWAAGLSATYVPRPQSVVGIIPIGAYLSFFTWLKTGAFDPILPAGVVIVIAALLMSLLLKRGFCGWICPVGAFFQIPTNIGRMIRKKRDLKVWKWLDYTLRGFRDALALMFVLGLGVMLPLETAVGFRQSPFYAIADIKIVAFFARPPIWWLTAGVVIVGLSLAYGNVWCRWICPLGGIYSTVGIASISNVVRDENICTQCGKCARACPNRVPVNKLKVVRATECDGCQTCVGACPENGALEPRFLGRFPIMWWMWPLFALLLWFAVYFVALATGHWASPLSPDVFKQAVQQMGL